MDGEGRGVASRKRLLDPAEAEGRWFGLGDPRLEAPFSLPDVDGGSRLLRETEVGRWADPEEARRGRGWVGLRVEE